jgi:hypothetical protein
VNGWTQPTRSANATSVGAEEDHRDEQRQFNYRHRAGYIKFFGTHAEYDRVDAATVDFTGVIHGKKDRRD